MEAVRYWLPRLMGVLSFLWFAVLAAPTIYWLESAELSATGIGLGSPPPAGEPLYMMLLKGASLLPIGELAFRANLLSALFGALAVGGVVRLVLVLGREDWGTVAGAFGAGAVLASSLLFARQATVAGGHTATAALIVVTLLLFERVASGGNARVGLSLAWVAGLGFALHPEYRMLMGLPIFALLCLRAYRGAKWPLLAPSMTIFSALAAYLYLPVRSATGRISAIDWGHPETLSSLWAHASGEQVSGALPAGKQISVGAMQSASMLSEHVINYLGVLALVGAFCGVAILLVEKRTRWVGVALVGVLVLDGYATALHPEGLVNMRDGVPLVIALCVCAGVAVAALASMAGPGAPFIGFSASVLMLLSPVMSSVSTLRAGGELPRSISEHALDRSPSGAVLFSQSESLSGGVTFLQVVEGARPDVANVALPRLADTARVSEALEATRSLGQESVAVTAERPWQVDRPVAWQLGPEPPPDGTVLVPGVVVGRLLRVGESPPPREGAAPGLRTLFAGQARAEPTTRRILAEALAYAGIAEARAGRRDVARVLLQAAIELWPTHPLLDGLIEPALR